MVEESGFRAALDCDVLFSCVDRPWPRAVLNYIALAHLIPVVNAGVHIKRKSDGRMRMASWRAHVAAPGRRCLECLGQFNSGFVTVEKDGSLDDPSYIAALPTDHPLASRQNVFAFSQAAAAQAMEQYLRMVVAPSGLADAGAQRHQFKLGTTDIDGRGCEDTCIYPEVTASGESTFEQFRPTAHHQAAEDARLERAANQRRLRVQLLDLCDRGLRGIHRRIEARAGRWSKGALRLQPPCAAPDAEGAPYNDSDRDGRVRSPRLARHGGGDRLRPFEDFELAGAKHGDDVWT